MASHSAMPLIIAASPMSPYASHAMPLRCRDGDAITLRYEISAAMLFYATMLLLLPC